MWKADHEEVRTLVRLKVNGAYTNFLLYTDMPALVPVVDYLGAVTANAYYYTKRVATYSQMAWVAEFSSPSDAITGIKITGGLGAGILIVVFYYLPTVALGPLALAPPAPPAPLAPPAPPASPTCACAGEPARHASPHAASACADVAARARSARWRGRVAAHLARS